MTAKCLVPGCGQIFANHGELITHIYRDHAGLKAMKKPIISIALASSLLAASLTAFAAEERHLPDARPDGRMCQSVTGGIRGMVEDFNSLSGTTYYTVTKQPLEAPLIIAQPFAVSLYDADGGITAVTFHNPTPGAPSETLPFSGTNDTWAQTYTVTQHVDSIDIQFPKAHFSTHICLMEIEASATVTEPTGLDPVLEPAQGNHVYLPVVNHE